MSIKYDIVSSYWLIVSNTNWCNTTTFYRINNNNYIIDITKLLVKIRKKFRKNGLLGNQKCETKLLLIQNISV